MATIGADLVRQMAAGDRDAFAVFYDHYAPVVFTLILRIVRERADASDVLQEVFWEAWRDAPAYDAARGSPEAWMSRGRVRARSIASGRPAGEATRSWRRWTRASRPPTSRRLTPPSAPPIAGRSWVRWTGCPTSSGK